MQICHESPRRERQIRSQLFLASVNDKKGAVEENEAWKRIGFPMKTVRFSITNVCGEIPLGWFSKAGTNCLDDDESIFVKPLLYILSHAWFLSACLPSYV